MKRLPVRINGFDRFCCVLAFPAGVVLLVVGVFGLFRGVTAELTLPPVLGVLPALVGWGTIRCIRAAWSRSDADGPPPEERFSQEALDLAR